MSVGGPESTSPRKQNFSFVFNENQRVKYRLLEVHTERTDFGRAVKMPLVSPVIPQQSAWFES